jgi:hypothetical protein
MTTDAKTAARRLFYPAALYNFVAGLPLLIDARGAAELMGMTPVPTDMFYVHGLAAVVVLFGGFYALAGFDPARYRLFIQIGIVAKLLFVALAYWHFLVAGDISWHMPAVASGDAVWSILFWRYLKQYPEQANGQPAFNVGQMPAN